MSNDNTRQCSRCFERYPASGVQGMPPLCSFCHDGLIDGVEVPSSALNGTIHILGDKIQWKDGRPMPEGVRPMRGDDIYRLMTARNGGDRRYYVAKRIAEENTDLTWIVESCPLVLGGEIYGRVGDEWWRPAGFAGHVLAAQYYEIAASVWNRWNEIASIGVYWPRSCEAEIMARKAELENS